jgi:hypothetical protein
METSKRVLGAEHPDSLSSVASLASTYGNQGRWKEAEELEVQVLETRKRVLGAEHPDSLTSMHNLAYTWKSQDRDEEAIGLMKQAERLRREQLGPNHPDTMSSTRALYKWHRAREAVEDVTTDNGLDRDEEEMDSDKDTAIGHSDSVARGESPS